MSTDVLYILGYVTAFQASFMLVFIYAYNYRAAKADKNELGAYRNINEALLGEEMHIPPIRRRSPKGMQSNRYQQIRERATNMADSLTMSVKNGLQQLETYYHGTDKNTGAGAAAGAAADERKTPSYDATAATPTATPLSSSSVLQPVNMDEFMGMNTEFNAPPPPLINTDRYPAPIVDKGISEII